MSLTAFISDFKEALSTALDRTSNPPPVIDGPVEFALNAQEARHFIAVTEGEIGYEPSDSLTMYKMPIGLEIGIYIEAAAYDRTQTHLERAREVFDDVWLALGGLKSSHFTVMRDGGERIVSDDASVSEFVIYATIHAVAKDNPCG